MHKKCWKDFPNISPYSSYSKKETINGITELIENCEKFYYVDTNKGNRNVSVFIYFIKMEIINVKLVARKIAKI